MIDYPFASQYRTRRYRIEHLDANNYFTYAVSKARHDSFYGGLAYHSLMVYREAMRIYEAEKDTTAKDVDPKSIIITTLLHDLCKLNRYPVLPGEKPQKIEYDRERTWKNLRCQH